MLIDTRDGLENRTIFITLELCPILTNRSSINLVLKQMAWKVFHIKILLKSCKTSPLPHLTLKTKLNDALLQRMAPAWHQQAGNIDIQVNIIYGVSRNQEGGGGRICREKKLHQMLYKYAKNVYFLSLQILESGNDSIAPPP